MSVLLKIDLKINFLLFNLKTIYNVYKYETRNYIV